MKKFGSFEMDERARELRKGGIRIRLQDQPFEILALMLERPGDIVTRDELRQRLWPAGTFVDFEHSLNAAVKRLRAALGDTADNPRFVETLHKRGYRFIAPIESDFAPAGATSDKSRENGGRRTTSVVPLTIGKAPREAGTLRLVVLPFANMGNDPTQEYFSDGLTEEMITQIGRLCPGKLGVLARSSSMRFKRASKSAGEIGRELAVDYLLEGSVRHEGNLVRTAAQLIDARTEVHLWAETYDRRLEESLLFQSDVAARIAQSLAIELVPEQREAIRRVSPRHSEAYHAYLKGRFHWNRTGDTGLETALGYYARPIDLDPAFATAHAALARGELALAYGSRQPGRVALHRARTAALRALDLDAGISDAHVVLAEVSKALDWNWTAAEASYHRAIALSPSCETAHRMYGNFLAAMGRPDEARREADRALWFDPICITVNTHAAWVRYALGEFDDAIDRCRHTLEMEPDYPAARRLLGAACMAAGLNAYGIRELEKVASDASRDPVSAAWLAHAKGIAGHRDEAARLVKELQQLGDGRYMPAYDLALAHTGIGDIDAAFAMLARACDERDPAVIHLVVEPRFAPLRDDARFAGLLDTLAIP